MNKLSEISKIIKQSKTFFIAGHINPDGDCLGSACALAEMLKRIGKKASIYSPENIPSNLLFLKGASKIKKKANKKDHFDCAIILESSDFSRMGNIISPSQANKIINIDHHKIWTDFGDVNYVVAESSSVAELILNIFEYMKIKPTKCEAECLYTGIMTDTGRFQNSNVSPQSHIAASKLIALGVSPNNIEREIYSNESVQSIKLLSSALSTIKTMFNGKLAYITVTQKMFRDAGIKDESTGGLISFTLRIKGVKVGCLLTQKSDDTTKLSFRSVEDFNLIPIVEKLKGGGHKNAAGATLNKNIKESEALLKKIFSKLK
ncbi:MAG: bifunctional oligoribonuclease/PAP phosphatase NrnA [Elusimicrobiota bacterium]|jgi:phosphoesterase RecJ-like protein|nr:bifunctional oligoribonuclease/PAP phosphatase NrnA [Elusimicrobiota bacterium]